MRCSLVLAICLTALLTLADVQQVADEKDGMPEQTVLGAAESEQALADVGQHGLQDQTASSTGSSINADDSAAQQADVEGNNDVHQADQQAAVGESTSVLQLPGPSTPVLPAVMQQALAGHSLDEIVAQHKEAIELLYQDVDKRDVLHGVQMLQKLAELVTQALPERGARRLLGAQPAVTPAAAGDQADGSALVLQQQQQAQEQRPVALAQTASLAQGTGLDTAGSALFSLAALQDTGVLPPSLARRSSAEVLMRLHRAAQVGSTEAQLALADRLFKGLGMPSNCALALSYARQAAAQVAADVEKELRFMPAPSPVDLRERSVNARYVSAEDLENNPQVIHMEEDMALRGSPEAQRRMAYRRLLGRGIEADPEGAFHDFQAGAAAGDPFAIFNLGYMYLRGLYVAQNYTEARIRFQQAAEKGMAAGWNGLGVLLWNGQGGEQNLTAALEVFQKGAAANHSDSLFNLAVMYGGGVAVAVNETKAFELYERAEKAGHWRAALNLAMIYETGAGTNKSCEMARHWYNKFFRERSRWGEGLTAARKAYDDGDSWGSLVQYLLLAEQGCDTAATNAAYMLRHGEGYSGPGYLDLARQLYARAALQNNTGALIELGHMLRAAEDMGLSVGPSDVQAAQLWAQAGALNDTEGLYLSGWAQQHGIGLQGGPNLTAAADLYRQAIKAGRHSRGRAVAPALALAAMNLDAWLLRWLGIGPSAITRTAEAVQRMLLTPVMVQPSTGGMHSRQLSSDDMTGGAEGEGGDGSGSGPEGLLGVWFRQSLWPALQRAYLAAGADKVDPDAVVITLLLGSLAVVLHLRQRQLALVARAHQQQQGETAAEEEEVRQQAATQEAAYSRATAPVLQEAAALQSADPVSAGTGTIMAASGSSDQAEHVSIEGNAGSSRTAESPPGGGKENDEQDVSGALGAAVDFVG